MTDVSQVPAVVHHAKHVVHAVPQVFQGVSYMTALISSVVSALVGAGLGWYVGKMGYSRVVTEIQNDITEIKAIIAKPAA